MNWCTTEWSRHRRPKHFAARRPAADAQGVDRSKAASRAGSPADDFALQKEKQEADRKRIEAQGIRDFQPTVAQNIKEQLLQWKGIEATERLGPATMPRW